MDKIFELITLPAKGKEDRIEVQLGIRIKLACHETLNPITEPCRTYNAFNSEVEAVIQNLTELSNNAKEAFEGSAKTDKLGLRPDMKPGEIWTLLSAVPDEGDFIQAFNALEERKRKEVAEHVLSHCNVFSGKAAVFSSRYDDKSASMK